MSQSKYDYELMIYLHDKLTDGACHLIPRDDEACKAYIEFLCQSVKNYPVLATFTGKLGSKHSSLLFTVVTELNHEWAHPAIKCLIERNPSALLSRWNESSTTLIYQIATHQCHHVLMPWVAEKYSWVLDNSFISGNQSPDARLVDGFGRGVVRESVLRHFFQVYPRLLLCQENGKFLPLNNILTGSQECSAEFFRWLVDQNSCAMSLRDGLDKTILHCAIVGLRRHRTTNMAQICEFIIKERPHLVQDKSIFELFREFLPRPPYAPYLLSQFEKDMIMMLLEVHSEHFDLLVEFKRPRDHFIGLRNKTFRELQLLMEERKDLKEDASDLYHGSINLLDATACSKNVLYSELSTVIDSWSTTLTQEIETRVHEISIEIDQVWTKYEEQHQALVVKFNG